ncbi:MAG: histidine--tRNA ligase [Bacilli bacterium]|nr:histidine--tRNA ligase [Bacilli bacterium]
MITKPKGTKDIYGKKAKVWKYIEEVIDSVMEKYNYNYIRTPIFESSELFHRGIGDSSDIVKKETYDFKDRGERNMTLRPEGTAGVVRSFIENKMYGENLPIKVYYYGTMYRYERPQAGRERELTQFGMEILGSDDALADAEMIGAAVNIYKMIGLKNIKVMINSLGDKESRDSYRKALVEHFKPHITDLCEDCKERINKNPLRILDCKVDSDKEIMKNAPSMIDYLNKESKERFEKVKEYLDLLEIEYEVDPTIVRGLDYYSHTVFEIKMVREKDASLALGGGGRYNDLVEILEGPTTPCIGFAAGLDRIVMTLEEEEIKVPIKEELECFILYVNEEEKKYATYLSQEIRMAGFSCDTEYTGRSLKAQFKQADRLKSKFLILLNSEDINNGQVTIKNNKTKEEEKIEIEYLLYYLDEHVQDEDYLEYNMDKDCDCDGNCKHSHKEEGHTCTCHKKENRGEDNE